MPCPIVMEIRSQDRLRGVPIIIITTRGDDTSRERALKAGATRYMTKPFEPQAIQAEVASIMGEMKAGA